MNLNEIKSILNNLSESDKQQVIRECILGSQFAIRESKTSEPYDMPALSPLELSLLPQILIGELKRQNITYEEMAIQIGVSISTFKRLIHSPYSAKAINLHSLLKELGIKVWLEK